MATDDGHVVYGKKYDGYSGATVTVETRIAFNTAGAAAGIFVARIPKGAKLSINRFVVGTAFNAAGTNVIVAGYGASLNELLAAGDVTEGTPGVYDGVAGMMLTFTEDKDVYLKFTETGTAATTGSGKYILQWTS